jgi:hypothetical protein
MRAAKTDSNWGETQCVASQNFSKDIFWKIERQEKIIEFTANRS